MKKNSTIGAVALAAVTVALTACTSPTEPLAAPSSSTASRANAAADEAIRHAVGIGAERMDRVAAQAALDAGKPFLVGLPDGSAEACHSALLLPDDRRVWILNESAVGQAGSALMEDRLQTYGCSSGEAIPPATVPAPATDTAMDTAAAEAAHAAGRPFIYAIPDGSNPTCNVAVIVAGEAWFLNRSGGARAAGDALSQVQRGYGCTAGEVVPGVPTSVNPN